MKVYLITNLITKKMYIGQTILSLEHRWGQHKSDSKRMRGPLHLVHSIRKYGSEQFFMQLLHECETKEEMDFVEMFYIILLNTKAPNGYNLTDGGDGTQGFSGWKASEETKAKLRLRKNIWLGRKHKPESILRMKVSATGRKASPETKQKMSESMGGWRHGTHTSYSSKKCRCEICRMWRHSYHIRTGH